MSIKSDDKYIVKITTTQSQHIKQLFNLINFHAKEININFSESAISINFHEELNISIIAELNNDDNGFSEFICREPITIGVNVPNIASLLKNIPAKVALTIFVEKNTDPYLPEKFGFIIQDLQNGKITTINIKTIDVNDEDVGQLNKMYSCSVSMQASEFLADINLVKQNMADTLQICYYNGTLKYITKNENKGDIEHVRINAIENNNSGHINIYVKLSKLTEIVKFSSISKTLTMYIQNNHILILEYNISNIGIIMFGIPNVTKPDNY